MKTEISKIMAARKRKLKTVSRTYPKFKEGMTVAAYCERYQLVNQLADLILPFDRDSLNHVPTTYDPSFPEVTEEKI